MVKVRETCPSGDRMIVVHDSHIEDGPTHYTPEEAEELRDELNRILG